MKPKRIFILAGEPSGDIHGAALAAEFKIQCPEAELEGWGGELMQNAGVLTRRGLDKLAFMGFIEVIAHLPTILSNFRIAKRQLREQRPDILLLIDYPGFNLRMARWAYQQGIAVYYFISPTVWAWKPGRMKYIEHFVRKLYCILPFEQRFYMNHNITNVAYLGNPLVDKIRLYVETHPEPLFRDEDYIAVLPGSRRQEIKLIFPIMVSAMKMLSGQRFKIAHAPSVDKDLLVSILDKECIDWRDYADIRTGNTYEVLRTAKAAIVTSGTATLETALFFIPQVVCYVTSEFNYQIAKSLVKLDYISLVNLIADAEIVKELIQSECTPEQVSSEVKKICSNGDYRKSMETGYLKVQRLLGDTGVATRVVDDILNSDF